MKTYFYFVDRHCVDFKKNPPFTMKHKMVIGPWDDRRSLIECVYGFHDYCTYNSSMQNIHFEKKKGGHRAYIIGYTWDNFKKHRGNIQTCPAIQNDEIIGIGDIVVVSCKALPVWAPKYLPMERIGMITNYQNTLSKRAYWSWYNDYMPKGMSKHSKWERKHFSNFTIRDIETCKAAWSKLPESQLVPGIPFSVDFRDYFSKRKRLKEKTYDAIVGIPKTLKHDIIQMKQPKDDIYREYKASCKPIGVCVRCFDKNNDTNKIQWWKRIDIKNNDTQLDDPYESLFVDYEEGKYCPDTTLNSTNTRTKNQGLITRGIKKYMQKNNQKLQSSNKNNKRKSTTDIYKKRKKRIVHQQS